MVNKTRFFMELKWILLFIIIVIAVNSCSSSSPAISDSLTSTLTTGSLESKIKQTPLPSPPANPIQSINTLDSIGMISASTDTLFVELAKQDLANRLMISAEEIKLLKVTDINWQDITQGCGPTSGQSLTKGRLSGYRIWLEANGKEYAYHIGLDGRIFLCPD